MGKILCKLKDKCKNSIILNKFKKIDKNYFIIAFICLILIGPLLSYFSVNGHDTQFHFANTKILLNYLISRHFNLFDLKILGIAGNNLGYGIGIFYPRFAHSILAYLTVFTRNIEISFKVFQYCVTLLSGIFMYKLIKRISKNNNAALVGSIFYICAPYFVSDFYIRNAVAESLNFIFTPMIFLGIYDYLFLNNKRNFYIFFVVGFIGVINSHLVTGLFLVFAIIIFLILNIKKMFNIKVLLNFALASLLILLLSSPSLVLMIQHKLFGNVGVFMKDLMGNSSWAYGTALNISDYFSFTFNEKNNGITFYLNLIMVIMAFYAIINVKKINNKLSNKKILPQFIILAIIAFIVSTKLVPWYKFPSIFLLIQFPWRLQLFTVFFLSI